MPCSAVRAARLAHCRRQSEPPGEPGVRLRCFLDLRQKADSEHQALEGNDPEFG
ncbi:DUF6207 family protein [Streptomyces sp. ME19-01-6]|uniref:DUF6207 family protein n=1 Tax=Streptomyces sp. ME19-01-6 TaxID=3028686 RepID=UPI0029BAD89F|nr:DUF6207 family protein [Streptomyces sp. ME19-01-6]MDX3233589.1 DUF6207 family protein [Streptomyces sp. ME19-01-6]